MKKKKIILIISVVALFLVAAAIVWKFYDNTYEGANEVQRFKNYIEINYQTAAERKKAIEEKAANGNPVAQYYLGLCHTQGGLGISKDYSKAIEWWKKAAENGNTYAQLKLYDCYRRGLFGLAKDKTEANKWYKEAGLSYKKAAEAGDVEAQYQLANLYARGYAGIPKNNQEAFKWYKEAAENGNAKAQLRLGFCYDSGMLNTPKSKSEAEKWYQKAIDQGSVGAMQLLGGLYAKSGDYEKAVKQWEKTLEKKSTMGEFCLMRCYELGLGVAKNDKKAAEYLNSLKKRLQRRAPAFLGYAYYYGQNGLPPDKAKGKAYLKEAAQKGDKRAAGILLKK